MAVTSPQIKTRMCEPPPITPGVKSGRISDVLCGWNVIPNRGVEGHPERVKERASSSTIALRSQTRPGQTSTLLSHRTSLRPFLRSATSSLVAPASHPSLPPPRLPHLPRGNPSTPSGFRIRGRRHMPPGAWYYNQWLEVRYCCAVQIYRRERNI